MNISLVRAVLALLALTFVLAACSSSSGTAWTFAPTASESEETASSAAPSEAEASAEASAVAPAEPEQPTEPEASAEPETPAEPEEAAQPEEPAVAAGEPRVVALQADSALRFTDADGQPVADIPVVAGETIRFEIDNTAGFPHNFYIGADEDLQVFGNTTDVGIPDWSTGVQTVDWVVPDDLTDLKFACTVAGHYYTMQGTFSAAEASAVAPAEASAAPAEASAAPAEPETPAEPEEPAEPETPAEPEDPTDVAPPPSGEARVIELEADPAIRFLQDGEQIREIGVTPGETVIFRIDNTAGFPHNFYIGADEDLQVFGNTTDIGVPDWSTGVQELEWTVPDDISNLRFACTVAGHYFTMQGDFTVSP